ncbi:MAG: Smr/MutS family protein [Bacteroidetes bacterium]|nr:Smr/MutS family protein [Bacteroidota bacterium]
MYPDNIEIKIGFDAIKDLLKQFCSSNMGKNMVENIKFSLNYNYINQLTEQTLEFKKIITEGNNFPDFKYCDISTQLKKMLTEGIFLTETELFDLKLTTEFIFKIKKFFNNKELKFPELFNLYKDVQVFDEINSIIEKVIDNNGELRTDASPTYKKLSVEIKKAEQDIHKKLIAVFAKAQNEGWTGETGITIREGRPVIPVKAEHKRKINGIVHDESGGGTLLYVEPSSIVEENNKLKHLFIERSREREQILKNVTANLKPFRDCFEVFYKKISITDLIKAKAQLAIKINASKPQILNETKNKKILLIDAFHPLLYLRLKTEDKKPVTLNCSLNQKQRIMVISGPNAGGKSVALKTIALNQYMLQCGMLVCASPDSEFSLFKNIMVDIGDNQSIDNNLSSYSAHLQAMRHFVLNAKSDSLFFIDELGSGTDPQFGGAIGEAILEKLNYNKAFGIVTSHFGNIKNFAGQTEGFINASMLYDLNNYTPLYKLVVGKPGSSYAIELAKKTGLSNEIIEKAKTKAGKTHQRIDEILAEHEQMLKISNDKLKTIEEKDKILTKLINDYNELKEKIKNQKNSIINQAKIQAEDIVNNSRKLIENTISEIKRTSANKETTSKLRKKINEVQKELKMTENTKPINSYDFDMIKEGTTIKIKGYSVPGLVLKKGKDNLLVETGLIKSKIPYNMIEDVINPKIINPAFKVKGYNFQNEVKQFNPRLDLRGMKADDAVKAAIDAVDKALMLNIDKIWILHGKGDGILRKLIRENLKKIRHVKQIESEHIDFGGDGISIVELA